MNAKLLGSVVVGVLLAALVLRIPVVGGILGLLCMMGAIAFGMGWVQPKPIKTALDRLFLWKHKREGP